MHSLPRRAVALALACAALLPTAACGGTKTTSLTVPLLEGGYALFELVDIPISQLARIEVRIEDALEGETYYLLGAGRGPPHHVGWFDVRPYDLDAADCLVSEAASWGPRCDLQQAGRFVARDTAGPLHLPTLEDTAIGHDGSGSSAAWYAILARGRVPTRYATITVTTELTSTGIGTVSPIRVRHVYAPGPEAG